MGIEPERPGRLLRRTVLLGLAGTVVGWGALGVEAATSPGHRHRAQGGTRPASAALTRALVPAAAVPTPNVPPVLGTHAPRWAKHWHTPIYDLDDFLHRSRHIHFPHRSVLLTVDDGPSPLWTPRYLRLFAQHHVTATFNLIGEQVRPNRRIVRAMVAEGHAIANHTWTHDERLPFRSRRDIHREIVRTNEAIHDATGHRPTQFRAPGGVWGPKLFAELNRQEMLPVDWNIDPRDWARPGTPAIERAMLAARPGDIILCHDGGGDRSETFRALQKVIPALKHRGFSFVALP
ncbi:polysaccharide deacetylase family protein [Nocardioides sp. BP30]|uniref:polysaccharide deacetylase family protein n=1 Tax=Nocardioides sp. BP30 TaxID=3036374 RepID=UPI00246848F2|nr:polysaccharide deacetylase family protein [Nocardioides sp. BP30]WGL53433.1 polysaccharide deacetylase family protein [Nocardioides sp. BP30]